MGEAKLRGSFEERKAMAAERERKAGRNGLSARRSALKARRERDDCSLLHWPSALVCSFQRNNSFKQGVTSWKSSATRKPSRCPTLRSTNCGPCSAPSKRQAPTSPHNTSLSGASPLFGEAPLEAKVRHNRNNNKKKTT